MIYNPRVGIHATSRNIMGKLSFRFVPLYALNSGYSSIVNQLSNMRIFREKNDEYKIRTRNIYNWIFGDEYYHFPVSSIAQIPHNTTTISTISEHVKNYGDFRVQNVLQRKTEHQEFIGLNLLANGYFLSLNHISSTLEEFNEVRRSSIAIPDNSIVFSIVVPTEYIPYVKMCMLLKQEIDPLALELWVDLSVLEKFGRLGGKIISGIIKPLLEQGIPLINKSNIIDELYAKPELPKLDSINQYKEYMNNFSTDVLTELKRQKGLLDKYAINHFYFTRGRAYVCNINTNGGAINSFDKFKLQDRTNKLVTLTALCDRLDLPEVTLMLRKTLEQDTNKLSLDFTIPF